MSNNFHRTAVLKKYELYSFTPKDSPEKKFRALHVLEDLKPLNKISTHLSVRKSREKLPTKI